MALSSTRLEGGRTNKLRRGEQAAAALVSSVLGRVWVRAISFGVDRLQFIPVEATLLGS